MAVQPKILRTFELPVRYGIGPRCGLKRQGKDAKWVPASSTTFGENELRIFRREVEESKCGKAPKPPKTPKKKKAPKPGKKSMMKKLSKYAPSRSKNGTSKSKNGKSKLAPKPKSVKKKATRPKQKSTGRKLVEYVGDDDDDDFVADEDNDADAVTALRHARALTDFDSHLSKLSTGRGLRALRGESLPEDAIPMVHLLPEDLKKAVTRVPHGPKLSIPKPPLSARERGILFEKSLRKNQTPQPPPRPKKRITPTLIPESQMSALAFRVI